MRPAAPRLAVLASLALLAACAGPANPGLRADHPGGTVAAADVDWAATRFTGAGGIELYAQRWRPRDGEPRAVVVIHHGLADHSTRYAALAERLVRAGFTVWALDMRGHGRSAGPRIDLPRVDDLLDDLDALLRLVRTEEPGRPVFLYGHSVGGLVTSLYTIERQPALAGLVLIAPALVFEAPALQAAATRVLGVLAPGLGVVPPSHAAFSHDPRVVAEMDGDPLISQGKGPARSARSILDGVARVWAAPARLTAPLLIVHGTADTLTAPAGSRDLVARAGGADRTLRLHDGLAHDPLREPDGAGARVTDEIVAWLDAHAGGDAEPLASSVAAGRLRGDPPARMTALELDARTELPRGDGATGVTAGLRARLSIGRAAAGLGYLGGLDLRGGALDGGYLEADAHVVGVAVRGAGGAQLSLTGGVGLGGVRGLGATRAPVELAVELPAGPVHLMARAALAWRLGGDRYLDDAVAGADEASALLGVRLGRDRRYWDPLTAGAGPYLALTYRDLGGAELIGVALGLGLWGGT